MATIPPRLTSIIGEANRLAPGRRTSSDGTLGDTAHQASRSDHNPDSRGIVHAVDLSQSTPGSPYWRAGYAVFDAHGWQRKIASAYIAGSPAVRASRFKWLKYMVGFNGAYDVIFDPDVSLTWRQNGSRKQDHANHAHFSIRSGSASENDTSPIFILEDDVVTAADREAIVNETVSKLRTVIREECLAAVRNALGGYVNGHWVDGALAAELRKDHNLSS